MASCIDVCNDPNASASALEACADVCGGGGGDEANTTPADTKDKRSDKEKRIEEAREERMRKAGTKYFEVKVPITGLAERRNYQFVAKLTDADGALDSNNNVVDGNSVTTSVRTLFETVEDIRTDADLKQFSPPTDPGQMLRELIDEARKDKVFSIYYDDESIRNTDYTAQYTFRDTQLRNCIDKLRELCPAGWHWFVDAGGKIFLRGPQHVTTHILQIGREALSYKNDKTIKNVKNIVILKGRQDEDASEPDGAGSIRVEVRDDVSVDQYGARYLFLRDSNIKDLDTARAVAQGRLEENVKPEERGSVEVLDEKEILYVSTAMRGYNVEAFQPGDFVRVVETGTDKRESRYYWDRALFNTSAQEAADPSLLNEGTPIKKVSYEGTHVVLELSERMPSATSDFQKLIRWQQMQEQQTKD